MSVALVIVLLNARDAKVDSTPRTVLVTGAASGIGRALCEELVETYGDFVIAFDSDMTGLGGLMAWDHGRDRIATIECDVTSRA